jgi:tRNA G46 methylase TrmB
VVDQLAELLAPEGEIHVATDIFDIALDAMAMLERETPSALRQSSRTVDLSAPKPLRRALFS